MNIISAFDYIFNYFKYRNERNFLNIYTVAQTHYKSFNKYKNIYKDKDIVLFATGPSLNNYKKIENAIQIGVNKSFLNKNLNLDYLFIQDYDAVNSYLKELDNEKFKNIIKFFGILSFNYKRRKNIIIPESLVLKYNANKYYLFPNPPVKPLYFSPDIDTNWIQDCYSVIFSAMQFALFTNPKRIYLVGCDCSSGYYDEKNPKIKPNKKLVRFWGDIKKFAETYYPETEIISVNPVGLKGLFKDLYQ